MVLARESVKPASLYVMLPASTRMGPVDEEVNSLELKTSFCIAQKVTTNAGNLHHQSWVGEVVCFAWVRKPVTHVNYRVLALPCYPVCPRASPRQNCVFSA